MQGRQRSKKRDDLEMISEEKEENGFTESPREEPIKQDYSPLGLNSTIKRSEYQNKM